MAIVAPRVLAWRHDLCRSVTRLLHRAVERHLRAWARGQGLADPRGGGVAVIQRFGGSVNLHVHVHALVLDGMCARTAVGALRFHAAPAPSAANMADILSAIVPAVQRLLVRTGLDEDDTAAGAFAKATPLLAGWAAASVQGLAAPGVSMSPPRRLGTRRAPDRATPASSPYQARWEGFDLHAGVRVPALACPVDRLPAQAARPPSVRPSADAHGSAASATSANAVYSLHVDCRKPTSCLLTISGCSS